MVVNSVTFGFGGGSVCVFPFFEVCCCVFVCCLCFLWVQPTSLSWSFPSGTFYRAVFVSRYCLNLVLSWNILFSPSMVVERFVGHSSLVWHSWSLSVYPGSSGFQIFHLEVWVNSGLYMLLGLFPLQFLIFFLYSVCLVFWLLYGKGTFFGPVYLGSVSFLYLHRHILL